LFGERRQHRHLVWRQIMCPGWGAKIESGGRDARGFANCVRDFKGMALTLLLTLSGSPNHFCSEVLFACLASQSIGSHRNSGGEQ
jgi:hypothetical protein